MMTTEVPIWEETVRGAYVDQRFLGLSGFEQIQTFLTGIAPKPPIHYLTGMLPTAAEPGTVTFTMPASGWLQAPPGSLFPGTLAMLADGPLGCAVQAALPPMTAYTTAELSMNYIRPTPADGRTLTCRGRLILAGKTLGLSTCLIEDDRGREIAAGSSRCLIFPPFGPPPGEPPLIEPWAEPSYDSPSPHERPVQGEILPQEVWDSMSGFEIMWGVIKNDLPAPPCHHLTGLRPTEAEEGACTFVLPATAWLCSPLGKLEGGAIAMLADSALQGAIQTTVPAGTSYAPIDLKVNFLRPVDPDGRELIGRGVVIHRGKTIAIANAELSDSDGKKVAVATGSALILPNRPWQVNRPIEVADEGPASTLPTFHGRTIASHVRSASRVK